MDQPNISGSTTTHYQVLGVDETADAATIKEAFRKLVLRHHPDKQAQNGLSDADQVQIIQRAYDVLRDVSRRRAYDESLRLHRQRIASRYESAIVLERADCTEEQDNDGLSLLVYPCRCGTHLDTSPLDDEDAEEDDGLLECPGCSLVYDKRKLHDN